MSFKTVFILYIFIEVVYSFGDLMSEWKSYKTKFNKQYSSPMEEQRRFGIFANELKSVEAFNAKPHSYKQGINEMSDWTKPEKDSLLYDFSSPNNTKYFGFVSNKAPTFTKDAPESKDWRENGVVSGIKNQGRCSSCWAFSVSGSIESIQQINGRVSSTVELSEQHLVDCYKKSCNGDYLDRAFGYIQRNGGYTTGDRYPYSSGNGRAGRCRQNRNAYSGQISGIQQVRSEDEIKDAIANVGPVAFGMCWAESLNRYEGGVYYDPQCDDRRYCQSRGHAMVLVGYGTDPEQGDFWLIKNSYGESFGEQGYLRIKRGVNHCNIEMHAFYPTINN